jgi:glycosyltransferase involved in cell wall biosynthesis
VPDFRDDDGGPVGVAGVADGEPVHARRDGGDLLDAGVEEIVAHGWKPTSEVAEAMARAAFLVLPSIWPESFPMVIIEALCQGLPVIASRIPALEEIIADGANGLLFAAGDAGAIWQAR